MSEPTKPKWTISDSADWITIIDPRGEIFFEFLVDDDTRKVTEEKVAKMVHAMNQHDGLVTVIRDVVRERVGFHTDGSRFCNLCKSTNVHVERCYVGKLEAALAGEPTI